MNKLIVFLLLVSTAAFAIPTAKEANKESTKNKKAIVNSQLDNARELINAGISNAIHAGGCSNEDWFTIDFKDAVDTVAPEYKKLGYKIGTSLRKESDSYVFFISWCDV